MGTIKCNFCFFFEIPKPKSVKILIISLSLTLKPVIFLKRGISNLIFLILLFLLIWISNLLILPPQISVIKLAAFERPSSIELGSMPLSNLNLASVSKFNNFEVLLTDSGKK